MRKLLLLAIGACLLASCAKNTGIDGPIDASRQKMLMDKAWQLKAFTLNRHLEDTNSTAQNIFNTIPACQLDNYFVFKKTTVLLCDHYLKCSLSTPDTLVYNYSLTNNESHMTIWSNPDDPNNSVILSGDMTYPSVDSFILTYQTYDAKADSTAQYVQTYVKIVPN